MTIFAFNDAYMRTSREKDERMNQLINHIITIIQDKKDILKKNIVENSSSETCSSIKIIEDHELSDSHPILKFLGLHRYPQYLPQWGFSDYDLFNYESMLDKTEISHHDRIYSPYYVILKNKITEILEIDKPYCLYFTIDEGVRCIRILFKRESIKR